jgi:hypothetical protein
VRESVVGLSPEATIVARCGNRQRDLRGVDGIRGLDCILPGVA